MRLDSQTTLALRGRPSIAWDGADYWLAATGIIDSNVANGRVIAFLKSQNGQQDWRVASTCLLDVPGSSVPFEWLALAIVDDKARVLVHRVGSPPSWLKLMDDSCEVVSQLQNSLLTRMQPSMIWSAIPDPVEEPTANALWIEQGPGPIFSGQVEGMQNRPVAGAVRSIAPHPSNPNVMYIGAVAGGVWKTENALARKSLTGYLSQIACLRFLSDRSSLILVMSRGIHFLWQRATSLALAELDQKLLAFTIRLMAVTPGRLSVMQWRRPHKYRSN